MTAPDEEILIEGGASFDERRSFRYRRRRRNSARSHPARSNSSEMPAATIARSGRRDRGRNDSRRRDAERYDAPAHDTYPDQRRTVLRASRAASPLPRPLRRRLRRVSLHRPRRQRLSRRGFRRRPHREPIVLPGESLSKYRKGSEETASICARRTRHRQPRPARQPLYPRRGLGRRRNPPRRDPLPPPAFRIPQRIPPRIPLQRPRPWWPRLPTRRPPQPRS